MVTLKRKEDIVERAVAGETFLVPIRGRLADLNELFVLNETGRWVWDHISSACSLTELASGMADEFEVDAETAAQDARLFAERLIEAGLADEMSMDEA